jgi:hypothetical protein
MKIIYFVCFLFLGVGLLNAKDIPLDTPTVVTGKLSIAKHGVCISNEDTISGRGNGFTLSHEPVRHLMVLTADFDPDKQSPRIEELKKHAGQTVILHGRFVPLNDRVWEYWGCRACFELSD